MISPGKMRPFHTYILKHEGPGLDSTPRATFSLLPLFRLQMCLYCSSTSNAGHTEWPGEGQRRSWHVVRSWPSRILEQEEEPGREASSAPVLALGAVREWGGRGLARLPRPRSPATAHDVCPPPATVQPPGSSGSKEKASEGAPGGRIGCPWDRPRGEAFHLHSGLHPHKCQRGALLFIP